MTPIQRILLKTLEQGSLTGIELRMHTNFSKPAINKHIAELCDKGYVIAQVLSYDDPRFTSRGSRLFSLVPDSGYQDALVEDSKPKRTKVNVRKHDGSVFGSMIAQLGF